MKTIPKVLLGGVCLLTGLPALALGGAWWSNRSALKAVRNLKSRISVGDPMSKVIAELGGFPYSDISLFQAPENRLVSMGGMRPSIEEVRKALAGVNAGELSVMVLGFVFLRHFVNVEFKDNTVTKVRLSTLD